MKKISDEKIKELESKIEEFESSIESSIELHIASDKESVENGDYNYLIEKNNIQDDAPLSEDLQSALDKSSLSKTQLLEKVIKEGTFELEYDELSSPFQYGGAKDNEFYCLQWGGDKDCQIDREHVAEFMPSFSIKDEFENFAQFEEFVKYHIGRKDHLDKYWEFATTGTTHSFVTYNTDYDVIRCVLTEEDALITFLKENKKPEVPFVRKTLKVTMEEYRDLREAYDGFCVKCGKINEGNHEPDAENYECSHCESANSFGIETLFMVGDVIIVDSEDESNLQDCYE